MQKAFLANNRPTNGNAFYCLGYIFFCMADAALKFCSKFTTANTSEIPNMITVTNALFAMSSKLVYFFVLRYRFIIFFFYN